MESVINSIDTAYTELGEEIIKFFEAKQQNIDQGQISTSTSSSLENVARKLETFKCAIDQAEDYVNFKRQIIACRCAVDEVTYEKTVDDFLFDGGADHMENDDFVGDGDKLGEKIESVFKEDGEDLEKENVGEDKLNEGNDE